MKKRKRRYLSGEDDDSSGDSLRKEVKQEIKVERDIEEPTQGIEPAQETSVVVKIEKGAYV